MRLSRRVLLPLFRQLGFHRITAAGHRDKALEYGKDIWMRYTLPTQHFLYFGIQVKRRLGISSRPGRCSLRRRGASVGLWTAEWSVSLDEFPMTSHVECVAVLEPSQKSL